MTETKRPDPLFINSLEKGLLVLKAFTPDSPEMTLGEIAEATGCSKSSVQRLCHTLHMLGYLQKDEKSKRFRPALKYLDFSWCYLHSDPLVRLATPRLIDLGMKLKITVNMAELDGTDIVFTIRNPHSRAPYYSTFLGRRVPAVLTTAGRVLLSFKSDEEVQEIIESWDGQNPLYLTNKVIDDRDKIMEEIQLARKQGYSITESLGASSSLINISVPVMDSRGNPIAAIQVPLLASEWDRERIVQEILPHMIETANSI